ncbi:prepilin-type N-terminal cleavage/methylation domain-containing protein [Shewanella avicenniae]|uniref:Prepilin-type N-terminal cleavage/methylation domain-containing protein n=1 Tax=Shewanella avicenniae TaxID=2814294 RepID=A0ABX7QLC3_9GAMM|nr:prepilin-type N-terminal cleavage/methylation domain-containing protein [Shewanella avicenniae]QSX32184.1 prepilin-type N-terminal cleavage/methylation domain-containing protein [Shewanella avicenniae]
MRTATWNRQTGFTLLEGMISIFLVAISGLGVAYTLSVSMKSQVTDNVQNLVLNELRGELASGGMQLSCSVAGQDSNGEVMVLNHDLQSTANASYSKHCGYTKMEVTIGGITQTVAIPQFTITVSDSRVGRYDMVIQN